MKLQSIVDSLTAPRGTLKYAKEAVMAVDTHNNMRLEAMRDMMAHARTKAAFVEMADRFINYLAFLTTNAKNYNVQQATRAVSELNCNVWLPLECGQATRESTIAAARAVFPEIADDLCDFTFESLQNRVADWINVMHFVLDFSPAVTADDNICLAFRAFWFKGEHADLMTANVAWCRMRDEALEMNRCISANFTITTMSDADRDWCLTARQSWMARRKVVRDAACSYNNAFLAFFHATDYETYTHACIAWLHLMDDALAMNEAWHLAQPCAAARNNAHYYELLIAKRQRKGYVAMTECHLAYQYILNDAIAGDMVKSCDVYRLEILFRDGSWLQLVETMTTDITPHGFYVKTQNKLA